MPTLKQRLDALNTMVAQKLNKLNDLKENKSNKIGSITVGVTDPAREYPNIKAIVDYVTSISNGDRQYTDDEVDGLATLIANTYIPLSQKGAANGVATLNGSGKVPSTQLPSFVDDIIEGTLVSSTVFNDINGDPVQNEGGKLYTDASDNKVYRWTGTSYIEISTSLAIGIIAGTAFEGDRGKALEDALELLTPRVTTLEDEFATYYKAMDGTSFDDYATQLDNATSSIVV